MHGFLASWKQNSCVSLGKSTYVVECELNGTWQGIDKLSLFSIMIETIRHLLFIKISSCVHVYLLVCLLNTYVPSCLPAYLPTHSAVISLFIHLSGYVFTYLFMFITLPLFHITKNEPNLQRRPA